MKKITHRCACGAELNIEGEDLLNLGIIDRYMEQFRFDHAACRQAKNEPEPLKLNPGPPKEVNCESWLSVSNKETNRRIEAARKAERERIKQIALSLQTTKCNECTAQLTQLIWKIDDTESEGR